MESKLTVKMFLSVKLSWAFNKLSTRTYVGNVELVPAGSIGFATNECLSGTLFENDPRVNYRDSSFVYDFNNELDGLRLRVCYKKAQKKQNGSR